MDQSTRYQFKAISRLRLFDVKAQKKTIPFKKFCSIPLTYQEILKQNFQSCKNGPSEYQSSSMICHKSKTMADFKRLSEPKLLYVEPSWKDNHNKVAMEEINKIVRDCGNIFKTGVKFRKKIVKIEKHSDRSLNNIHKRVDFIINEGANNCAYR